MQLTISFLTPVLINLTTLISAHKHQLTITHTHQVLGLHTVPIKLAIPDNPRDIVDLFIKQFRSFKSFFDTNKRNLQGEWTEKVLMSSCRDKGIVIPAGGGTPLANAFVVSYILRNVHRSQLPIALVYWQERELNSNTKTLFHQHIPDIEFIDLSTLPYPSYHIQPDTDGLYKKEFGYRFKAYALWAAPFKEVIMLDADSIPLYDPIELFGDPLYTEKGSLFWPDFWRDQPEIWEAFGMEEASPWRDWGQRQIWKYGAPEGRLPPLQTESGQLVFNKAQHWDVLEWILFLNTHTYFTYEVSIGDKDTYRVAFELAGKADSFGQSPHPPAFPIVETPDMQPPYWNLGMLQLHPDGRPYFHHRTANSKFSARSLNKRNKGPITHITLPSTPDQASMMLWGKAGGTVTKPLYGEVQWGFQEHQILIRTVNRCGPLTNLTLAQERCHSSRGVTMVPVSKDDWIANISTLEGIAHELYITSMKD